MKQQIRNSSNEAIYAFGLIGALVYFLGKATTFSAFLLGLLKSLVWPGILVFELLKFLIK